jgi:hypothetical protein
MILLIFQDIVLMPLLPENVLCQLATGSSPERMAGKLCPPLYEGQLNMAPSNIPLWHKDYFELKQLRSRYKQNKTKTNHPLNKHYLHPHYLKARIFRGVPSPSSTRKDKG